MWYNLRDVCVCCCGKYIYLWYLCVWYICVIYTMYMICMCGIKHVCYVACIECIVCIDMACICVAFSMVYLWHICICVQHACDTFVWYVHACMCLWYVCVVLYVCDLWCMYVVLCMRYMCMTCKCMHVCGEQVWYVWCGLCVLCVNTLACAPSRLLLSAFLRAVTGSGENCVWLIRF